jgi:hypothetical protein
MSTEERSSKIARRRILKLFGFGAAGTAVGAVVASNRIFAKQFVDDGLDVKLPLMTYGPQLQMMVDPRTRRPIYEDASRIDVASGMPTVTAGCSDCPKKDDTGS